MMSQPIRIFQDLTSEIAPAGGNDKTMTAPSHEERRMIEARARHERAALIAEGLGAFAQWLRHQYGRMVRGLKAGGRIRTTEDQLYRMSDRELADIGLARSDIRFAVREDVQGFAPSFDVTGAAVPAVNENLRRVA